MRVLVTQPIDPAGRALLDAAGLDVTVHPGPAPMTPAALREAVRGCAGLISMPTDRIDGDVLDAGPVRVVAQHAVGLDNVDLDAARARGVVVTNTPGVLTDATADLAMALLLAASRHVVAGDRLVRRGGFQGWRPMMLRGLDLAGARLGIVGFGRIGRAVARRAAAFGMEVVHSGRPGADDGLPFDTLLATSDVVSLHCPLTPATHHLVDAAALARMKPTAVLVNTARGPVVDEAALAAALRAGRLAAAALDVFEAEPVVHPDLLDLDNVVLAPHLGSATWQTRRAMATKAATNLLAFVGGQAPPDRVV
ncbi:MAG: D-glycerate dehydrogenase [Alphaproteobacteria bacterium]|nr:D-glycerate dehydrogenase [Alphaproteobacteria bacterium]